MVFSLLDEEDVAGKDVSFVCGFVVSTSLGAVEVLISDVVLPLTGLVVFMCWLVVCLAGEVFGEESATLVPLTLSVGVAVESI